jgi:tRNA nucleotidyltransferase (CCA-adding enzyme)
MTAALISGMSASQGRTFCKRLWNRSELIEKALRLAETFREISGDPARVWTPSEIRRLSLRLDGTALLCALLKGAELQQSAEQIARTAKTESVYDAAPEPLITGRHGIAMGIAPGPELGKLVKQCFEAQLDGLFRDLEEGKSYLHSLLKEEK